MSIDYKFKDDQRIDRIYNKLIDTGDGDQVTLAADLGVSQSTISYWLHRSPHAIYVQDGSVYLVRKLK